MKLGLQAANPEKYVNQVDAIIGNMAQKGQKTAGKTFVGAAPIKFEAPTMSMGNGPTEGDIKQPQSFSPKNAVMNLGEWGATKALPFLGNEAKKIGKNVWNFSTTIPRTLAPAINETAFQLTHNMQTPTQYFNERYNGVVDQIEDKKRRMQYELAVGRLSKEQYDQGLLDLQKDYQPLLDIAYDNQTWANNTYRKYRDWQTGEYRDAKPEDIFTIVDTAITVASVGTAGLAKGTVMQSAETGLFRGGETWFLQSLGKVAGKDATIGLASRPSYTAASQVFKKVDDIIAGTITRVPGLKEYSERQIAKLGGDIAAKKFVTNALAEVVIHSPLRRMNMQAADDVVTTLMDSTFLETPEGQSWLSSGAGQALLLAGMTMRGGPLGFALTVGKKAGIALKTATFGDDAVKLFDKIDPAALANMTDEEVTNYMVSLTKDEQTGTIADHFMRGIAIDAEDPARAGWKYLAKNPEIMDAFKSYGATLFKPGYWEAALSTVIKQLKSRGMAITPENAFPLMMNWQKSAEIADEITKVLVNTGKLKPGMKGVVVAFTKQQEKKLIKAATDAINQVTKQAVELGDVPPKVLLSAQKDAVKEIISVAQKNGETWAQHDDIVEDLIKGIDDAKRSFSSKKKQSNSIINAIKNRNKGVGYKNVPKKLADQLKANGYVYAVPDNVGNPFVGIADSATYQIESLIIGKPKAGVANIIGINKPQKVDEISKLLGDDVVAVRGSAPGFGRVGDMLSAVGIGLGDTNAEAYRLIRTNAVNHLDDIGVEGARVLNQLEDFIEAPPGTKVGNIVKLRTAITDMRQLTVNEIARATGTTDEVAKQIQRGIIQSHIDVPIHIRGLADSLVDRALQFAPQRLYSRVQGALRYSYNPFFKIQEITETKILSAGETNAATLFNPKTTSQIDEVVKKMEDYRLLEGAKYGEAATNVALGRVTANITRFQKRDLARVIDAMADKMTAGDIDQLITQHYDEVVGAIRPIVQYPTRGVLNSNMARMLNLAAFPARYNIKVGTLAAKYLAKQTPSVQAAVLRGLWDFDAWLKTPDGLSWQQDYADAIAVFKWVTPVGNLDWVMRTLQGENNSWSEFGQLGGLPFGLWTSILTNQGLLPEQPPYVSPETGDIFPRRMPESLKGRASMAIMDMLGSTFTYPGRTLGLPGKTAILRDVAEQATGASGKDFSNKTYTVDDLPENKKAAQQFWYVRKYGKPELEAPLTAPAAPKFNIQQVPRQPGLVRYNRSDLRAAKEQAKSIKSNRSKQPVPFQQIINR